MIDETVKPIVQKPIPYNLMQKAEQKVEELLKLDIIERVPDNEVRTWVSPVVIAPKSNNIRFCTDMGIANQALK